MDINRFIDHTLLKPDAGHSDIAKTCLEATENRLYSVCVNSCWVSEVKKLLDGSDVKVCAVIGFPLGSMSTKAKVLETEYAVIDGAVEIDMVINIGFLKSGLVDLVRYDIREVAYMAHKHGAILKVIIETCLLTEEEKKLACTIAVDAGADFVKTSTGFSTAGATINDVALMRSVVGPSIGVKASGGVRSLSVAQSMIAAGATRIGSSSGVQIMKEVSGVCSSSGASSGSY